MIDDLSFRGIHQEAMQIGVVRLPFYRPGSERVPLWFTVDAGALVHNPGERSDALVVIVIDKSDIAFG